MLASAVEINLLPSVARSTTSDVERNSRRYHAITDSDKALTVSIPGNFADGLDDIFAQDVL